MLSRRERGEGGLASAIPNDARAQSTATRGRTLRWLCVAALATAGGCGGCSVEVTAWPEPIAVSGTTEIELRPPAIIPSMWGQAANLELCFEMSTELPGRTDGAGQIVPVAPSLREWHFQAMTAKVHTAGSGLHVLEDHALLGNSFCLSEPPLSHWRQKASRVEITSRTPVTLNRVRLLRVAHP
jgi:hypothetical protein